MDTFQLSTHLWSLSSHPQNWGRFNQFHDSAHQRSDEWRMEQSCRILQRVIHTTEITGKQKLKSLWNKSHLGISLQLIVMSWEYHFKSCQIINHRDWMISQMKHSKWFNKQISKEHYKTLSIPLFKILPKSQLNGKKAKLSSFPKKKPSSFEYRPITLLNTVFKLQEVIVWDRIKKMLLSTQQKHHILWTR